MLGSRFVQASSALLLVFLLASPASAERCELEAVSTDNVPPLRTASWGWDEGWDDDWDDDSCSHFHDDRHDEIDRPSWPKRQAPERYALDLFDDGFGVKVALGPGETGWHFAFSQRDTDTDDLEMQLGLIYRIPEPFIVFHAYGGGGMSYTLPQGRSGPYFVTGTEFLFMFWEHGYLFEQPDWGLQRFHRAGLRFRF